MRRLRRLLSAVLAILLVLPYIPATGIALDGSYGASGNGSPFRAFDPALLGVKKLGDITVGDGGDSADPVFAYNDTVRVSIFLEDESTVSAGYSLQSVAKNKNAIAYRNALKAKQKDFVKTVEKKLGHSLNVKWNLTLLANAISVEVKYFELIKISTTTGVKTVEFENRYDPQTDSVNTAGSSGQMVFAQSAWDIGYTGAGTRIAIIDTGIDTAHQSFSEDAFLNSIGELGKNSELMTAAEINALAAQLNTNSGNYVSAKIPYAYNYIDKNTTVNHMSDTQGEHGSHVAGIAAANKYIRQGNDYVLAATADTAHAVGMAPDAQLFVMKVFGSGGGAYDSDYMAAIEDAIVLGCDACNLSLGSGTQGFTYASNEYQTILNDLANGDYNDGMVVSISAGNSGSFADYLEGGAIYLDDVYMHTGGSPGTYINSLCTASADNVLLTTDTFITVSGNNFFCYEDADGPVPLLKSHGTSQQVQFVYIDAVGNSGDYSAVNKKTSLNGKLVIVNRGDITFSEKGDNAKKYSPLALLVANNSSGVIQMNLDGTSANFPMASITLDAANYIKSISTHGTTGNGGSAVNYYTGTLILNGGAVSIQQQNGTRATAKISDFSSWGVPGSLLMKPEITAPGGDIWSVLGAHKTKSNEVVGQGSGSTNVQYESMSGTSMAAPHIAGLAAIVAQYVKENDISVDGYSRRAVIQSLLMSTATPMMDGESFISILQQGAGLADVNSAVSASSVIFMTDFAGKNLTTETGAAADGKVKAEIGDDPERTGVYTYSFRIYNISGKRLEFNAPTTTTFTQGYLIDGGEYYMDTATVGAGSQISCVWAPHGTGVTNPYDVNLDGVTDANDAQAVLDCLTGLIDGQVLNMTAADGDGDGAVTSHDAYLILVYAEEHPAEYYIPAGGYADVTVTFGFEADADVYTAGAYIEGFTTVSEKADREGVAGVTHTIPILGFWGSFTDPEMFDTKSYTDGLYGSTQVNYSGNDTTNYLTLTYGGVEKIFSGNPYAVEDSFPADRLAVRSNSQFKTVYYTLVRSAGTTGFAVGKLDQDGYIDEVLRASLGNADVTGMWFNQSQEAWQNTSVRSYNVGSTAAGFGLSEGDRFRVGFYALPEYYGMYWRMQSGGSLTDDTSGVVGIQGFRELLTTDGLLGSGALVGYDLAVDDTAPEIALVDLEGDQLSVRASDNLNIAYIAVLSLDGQTKYAEAVPGADAFEDSFNIAAAVTGADGYVAVFVADYAGNETAVAVMVNSNTGGVDPSAVTSITLLPSSIDIYKRSGADITASVLPLTASDRTVVWTTSDPAVATVDEFGHVTGVSAGTCTVTATSVSNSAVSASCSVKVTAVDKVLNGIIWDKLGDPHFASLNASDPSDWVSLSMCDDGDTIPLNTAFVNGSTLYAATLDVDSEEWETVLYTVDADYELTEVGTNYLAATDIARAPTAFSDYMVYSYGPYLVFGNIEPQTDEDEGTYSGFPYAFLEADAYIAGVAAKSVSDTSASYYYLDENGKIWETNLSYSQGEIVFSNPAQVVDTGIQTMIAWQNLYFDGTYIYWGNTDDVEDWAQLIIIDPATETVYSAGDFGERIWPAGGFYVAGQDAPASAGEPSADVATFELSPVASREELLTGGIRDRIKAETEKVKALRESMAAADKKGRVVQSNGLATAKTESAAKTAVATSTGNGEADSVITYIETVDVTNGFVTLEYDPDELEFVGVDVSYSAEKYSVSDDSVQGLVKFAYAVDGEVTAGSPIVQFRFDTVSGSASEIVMNTLERSTELTLSESEVISVNGFLNISFSHSCSLGNNLSINYYIPTEGIEGYENYRLVVNKQVFKNDGSVEWIEYVLTDYSNKISRGVPYMVFAFKNIAAKEMGNDIHAVLYMEKNDKTYQTGIDIYSIKTYAYNRLEKSSSEYFKRLMVDMLNYGAAAQEHFEYNVANPVNNDLSAAQKALASEMIELSSKENTVQTTGASAEFYGKSVVLGNSVELKYYMTFAGGAPSDSVRLELTYTSAVGTNYHIVIPASEFEYNTGYQAYSAKLTTIAAKDMFCVVTAEIYDGDVLISDVIDYSIESYVFNRLNSSTNESFKALARAMILYGKSAEDYFKYGS